MPMELNQQPTGRTRPVLVLAHLSHLQSRLQDVPAALLARLRPVFERLPQDDPARDALEPNVHRLEEEARRTTRH